MDHQLPLDESLLAQLRDAGEIRVSTHGESLVLMTLEARERLGKLIDLSEWTPAESQAVAAQALSDPEGWGAEGMSDYEGRYRDLFADDAE